MIFDKMDYLNGQHLFIPTIKGYFNIRYLISSAPGSSNNYQLNQSTYDYVKLYIGYFSSLIPVWEGMFTLENLT